MGEYRLTHKDIDLIPDGQAMTVAELNVHLRSLGYKDIEWCDDHWETMARDMGTSSLHGGN